MFNMLLFFLFTLLSLMPFGSSKIIANFVLPHGGIALDPSHFHPANETALEQAWEIHNACKRIGNDIADIKPDVVFLSTPHGIADLRNFVFYVNPKAEGSADTDNCKCPPCCYNILVNIDVEMTEDIMHSLGYERNVSGLSGYGPPGESSELFPLKREPVVYKAILYFSAYNSGASLYTLLEKSPKRVVVIISADLAHTHSASGPYGYSNTSEPFDEAIGKWASTLQSKPLLVTAASLVDQALSCGFTGLVTLHGLMEAGDISNWDTELLVNHHPSYYGMMVAAFHRQQNYKVSVHLQK